MLLFINILRINYAELWVNEKGQCTNLGLAFFQFIKCCTYYLNSTPTTLYDPILHGQFSVSHIRQFLVMRNNDERLPEFFAMGKK